MVVCLTVANNMAQMAMPFTEAHVQVGSMFSN